MAHYDFKKDITIGEDGEKVVIEYLQQKGLTLVTDNKDNRFDIEMKHKDVSRLYEIKTDVYCTKERNTGNMFIEFQCRGKDSGILVTKADWFVTFYPYLKEYCS